MLQQLDQTWTLVIGIGVVEVEFGGTKHIHDRVKDTELSSCQRSNHDATGQESDSAELDKSDLLGDVHQTRHHGSSAAGSLLVDFGKKRIRRVRDNGRGNSGNDTRSQRDGEVRAAAQLSRCLAKSKVGTVSDSALHDELGAGVGDLLRQNGEEAGIETTETFRPPHFTETIGQTRAPGWVRDGSNANSFQGAQENVSNELSSSGSTNVDAGLILPCLLLAQVLDGIDLEELHSTKLEPSLDKVPSGGCSKARRQGHGSFLANDLPKATNETLVVLHTEETNDNNNDCE